MKRLLSIMIVLLLSGCAHVISKELRSEAVTNVQLHSLWQDPDAYKGRIFILGGSIVGVNNTKDKTVIEVVQLPIDSYGRITNTYRSEGRFLAEYQGYLDPSIYKKGLHITMAGEVIGSREMPLDKLQYKYPVLSIKQLYLWTPEVVVPAYPDYYWGSPYPYPYPYPDWRWQYYPYRPYW